MRSKTHQVVHVLVGLAANQRLERLAEFPGYGAARTAPGELGGRGADGGVAAPRGDELAVEVEVGHLIDEDANPQAGAAWGWGWWCGCMGCLGGCMGCFAAAYGFWGALRPAALAVPAAL
jgi:hypothetical protein